MVNEESRVRCYLQQNSVGVGNRFEHVARDALYHLRSLRLRNVRKPEGPKRCHLMRGNAAATRRSYASPASDVHERSYPCNDATVTARMTAPVSAAIEEPGWPASTSQNLASCSRAWPRTGSSFHPRPMRRPFRSKARSSVLPMQQ
ncbi:hypothetical protein ACLOJK_014033 [Asimina triloba]